MKKTTLVLTLFAATFLSAQNVPSYVPTNGLIGWWPFDGNANDESGNGNHGTIYGAAFANDRGGDTLSSLEFSSQDYMCTASSFNSPNTLTYAFWMKTTSANGQIINFDNGNCSYAYNRDRSVFFSDSNEITFFTYSPTVNNVSTGGFSDGNWNHVVVTMDSSGSKVYLNSSLVSAMLNQINGQSFTGKFKVGAFLNANNNGIAPSFEGLFDDFGLWDRALTPTEIQDLYNGNGCTYIDTVLLSVTDTLVIDVNFVGLNPIQYEYSLKAYPNPTNDMLFIDSPINFITQGYSIEVKNSLGQSIYQGPINQSQIQLDLTTWGAGGLYFLHLYDSTNNLMDVKKIVIK